MMTCTRCNHRYYRETRTPGVCWECDRKAGRGTNLGIGGAVQGALRELTGTPPEPEAGYTTPEYVASCTCPRCQTVYPKPIGEGGVCRECAGRAMEAMERRERYRRKSGVPLRHERFRAWAELHGSECYIRCIAAVRNFTESGDSILALIGKRGTGKTAAACVAIWQTIEAGRAARYTTVIDLLADLRGRYGDGGAADADWLRNWCVPHLLVVDEVVEKLETAHTNVMLTSLLDRRYAQLRPTIIVGNVTAERFSECVGGSIADRCGEGGGLVLFDKWPSFRAAPRSELAGIDSGEDER